MKKFIIAVGVICMLSISVYAADYECDAKYRDKLKKLNSLTVTEMSEESKSKYRTRLEEAYQLCKEGKKEEAMKMLVELKDEKEFDTVFSGMDGN